MKTIKDSVHDHITVDGVARALLDTPPVQRLRHVSQLGTVNLVYPSANHTRFEHSLGVYHLACRALEALDVAGPTADHVMAAALLHDVGHAPYSHTLEEMLAAHTGRRHDDVDHLVTAEPIGPILTDHDLDPSRIAGLIAGEGRWGQLIAGELDVDRMDYLIRDAHHTGVPYGTIDVARLVRELRFVDGELVLGPGNIEAAESLLVARALMNPTVYNHHVARISKTMLRRATARFLEASATAPATVQRMDDHDLLAALRGHHASQELVDRLDRRALYKRAVWLEYRTVPLRLREADAAGIAAVEADIAAAADVDPHAVLVDVPVEPRMRESTARVMVGNDVWRLEDRSPLVRALREIQREQWRCGIYAPSAVRDRVAAAAARVLELPAEESLVDDSDRGRYARLDEFRSA